MKTSLLIVVLCPVLFAYNNQTVVKIVKRSGHTIHLTQDFVDINQGGLDTSLATVIPKLYKLRNLDRWKVMRFDFDTAEGKIIMSVDVIDPILAQNQALAYPEQKKEILTEFAIPALVMFTNKDMITTQISLNFTYQNNVESADLEVYLKEHAEEFRAFARNFSPKVRFSICDEPWNRVFEEVVPSTQD